VTCAKGLHGYPVVVRDLPEWFGVYRCADELFSHCRRDGNGFDGAPCFSTPSDCWICHTGASSAWSCSVLERDMQPYQSKQQMVVLPARRLQ
jgi:hypothetical protein